MNSENLHKTSEEQLKQLQDELNKGFIEGLKNSQVVEGLQKILQENALEGHHVLQLQLMLDLTKLQFTDTVKEQQFNNFLQINAGNSLRRIVLLDICTSCNWAMCN